MVERKQSLHIFSNKIITFKKPPANAGNLQDYVLYLYTSKVEQSQVSWKDVVMTRSRWHFPQKGSTGGMVYSLKLSEVLTGKSGGKIMLGAAIIAVPSTNTCHYSKGSLICIQILLLEVVISSQKTLPSVLKNKCIFTWDELESNSSPKNRVLCTRED